jgi:hypothetical protein
MLLLLRAHPDRSWSPDDVGRELRMDPSWAIGQLETLASHGILEHPQPQHFRYAPKKPGLADTITRVADAYADFRVTIIGLIFSKPSPTLKSFADAFRIRKDKTDG